MVICLERGADLHMAQLMPLSLAVFCFSKIQIGFTFLVPAHPGSPGQRAIKRVCETLPILCNGVGHSTKIATSSGGSKLPPNTLFLGPMPVHNPYSISIGTAVSAGLTAVSRHID